MVPDNVLNTSANTTSPLFPNTTVADLGISSGLWAVDSLLSKSIGSPSSLNSERTASELKFQNDDSLIVGDGGTILAGQGKDIINAGEKASTIFASEGNKIITGSPADDTIYTTAGDDIINGGDGNNTIFAGKGNNRVVTGSGNDFITAGDGNNQIYTGKGNDTITVGNGNNIIKSGSGNDTVSLGSGSNQIILEAGEGSVNISGFNPIADKLRLGGSLVGKPISLVIEAGNTLVKSGDDLLAMVRDVTIGVEKSLESADIPLYRYEVVDLGATNSAANNVRAAAINDQGQIIGRSETGATVKVGTATRAVSQGFIWEDGQITGLTSTGVKNGGGLKTGESVTPYGGGGFSNAINDRGIITGTADEINGQPTDRGLLWQKKDGADYSLDITDLGGIESYFFDINNKNEMPGRHIYGPGSTEKADNRSRPLYVEQGFINPLPDLGGDTGTAQGINNKSTIVGQVDSDGLNDKTVNTAVKWEKGADGKYKLTNLGTFGAEQANLRDINDAGQIIGWTSNGTGATLASSPFLLQDGQKINLGSFGGAIGQTAGINQFGQVVGYSQDGLNQERAFVWNNGKIQDLNKLVLRNPTFSGQQVTLTRATGINNFGDISAWGTYTYKDDKGVTQTGSRSYLLKALPTT